MTGTGRVAVVTGASRGLGRAICLRLASQGTGIVALARTEADVLETAELAAAEGVGAVGLVVDVTSAEQVDRARAEVQERFGHVDIVVNNAGVLLYKPFVPLPGVTGYPGFDEPVSDDEWAGVLDVHLTGAVRMLRAFGPGMIERRHGRVVNIVSNVVRRAVPFTTVYDTAKGGLVQLTRSLAREWGRYGVTVNAVAAGHFPTEMSRAQFENEESLRKMLRRVPAGRTGQAGELASLVAFLSGEEAGYITGETIAIDGGETL